MVFWWNALLPGEDGQRGLGFSQERPRWRFGEATRVHRNDSAERHRLLIAPRWAAQFVLTTGGVTSFNRAQTRSSTGVSPKLEMLSNAVAVPETEHVYSLDFTAGWLGFFFVAGGRLSVLVGGRLGTRLASYFEPAETWITVIRTLVGKNFS